MDKQELLDEIAFNVIQGRLESEDEGFDPGPPQDLRHLR